MNLKKITDTLYRDVQVAANDIFRYNRIERYSINQVLNAAAKNRPVDEVYIRNAEQALLKHELHKPQIAA